MGICEKPLDKMAVNGGFTRIFQNIACIGDSLSSGEFEFQLNGERHCVDMYEYSWGQVISRTTGAKVYNFSRGGMTAKWYMESYGEEQGFFDEDKKCQAYIIAMGLNDAGNYTLGSVEDIKIENYKENKNTFCGFYGGIIQRYKEIQPKAKFFLMTMPRDIRLEEKKYVALIAYNKEIRNIAKLFDNTYLMDFEKYAPLYDEDFRDKYFMEGHLNPMGYVLTADYVMSYIDYIIRYDMEAFKKVGLMGTHLE